jgi:hypothetical protein
MKYTHSEIANIIEETLFESAKDIIDLENRRPLISLAVKTMYKVMERLSGIRDDESQINSRDVMTLLCAEQVVNKLKNREEKE